MTKELNKEELNKKLESEINKFNDDKESDMFLEIHHTEDRLLSLSFEFVYSLVLVDDYIVFDSNNIEQSISISLIKDIEYCDEENTLIIYF